MDSEFGDLIEKAQAGEAAALDRLVRRVQDRVYRLALRMLPIPDAAQDATQEILILVVTRLSTFEGRAGFNTWVHRIAVNYLLTAKKVAARDPAITFDWFAEDLEQGLVADDALPPEDHVMLNELRLRCTMAMLVCLDRDHRAAYVLGEVLQFDQAEAAEVLEIRPDLYRKRLSRARADVVAFTARACGLANAAAPCRCRRRLPAAVAAGRVGQVDRPTWPGAPEFKDVEAEAARTEAALVAAKLQRATGALPPPVDLAARVLRVVNPPD